jgi:hypothetical protein
MGIGTHTFFMACRFPAVFLLLILILFTASTGCTSAPIPQSATAPVSITSITPATSVPAGMETISHTAEIPVQSVATQLAAVKSDNAIWREAYRMFLNMKSTDYVHPPYTVDDAKGVYQFDCLGFVDHVLINANPTGYKVIGKGLNPSIESYAAYFSRLDPVRPDTAGWTKVAQPGKLKPGDVCLWLKPTTLDTGHMWIIAGEPKINLRRNSEVLVRIFDSSTAHSDDSRTGSAYPLGLGSGILGMMVDGEGNPVGLYWDGGTSPAGETDTTIVCGRLDR